MYRLLAAVLVIAVGLTGCSSPGTVGNKVLGDFGIIDRPDEYQSQAEAVQKSLSNVGPSELRRLNQQSRQGTVKFQEDGLRGMYYKEVKVYEDFYPLDARATRNAAQRERGFDGFIEYNYQIYQSERRPTRTEAAAESATIPTGETGGETFRYNFSSGGVWDGNPGTQARKK